MTHDEIIEMAREAGFTVTHIGDPIGTDYAMIEAFANLVAAKEREANIKIIKETPFSNWFQADVIEAIRARGE
jgi:sugar phosphate isomerase/epimerase